MVDCNPFAAVLQEVLRQLDIGFVTSGLAADVLLANRRGPQVPSSMWMTVVNVRVVDVHVGERLVTMRMDMRLLAVPWEGMLMLVMLVMPMRMSVLELLVCVQVLMTLPEVQPESDTHQDEGCPEKRPG